MKKYCVLGEDNRSLNLKEMYIKENKEITTYDLADVVIAVVPFSRDNIYINGLEIKVETLISHLANTNKILYSGAISKLLKEKLDKENVKYFDLLEFEEVAILNAIPTAEGAIAKAMEVTDITLHDSNILVMGYGRIGKILSHMLNGIGAKVYCEARSKKDIALIKSLGYNSIKLEDLNEFLPCFDVIFNTIPVKLLDEKRLNLLKLNCIVIDLASSPFGVDFDYAKKIGIKAFLELALPAKVAPYTAAKYLKNTIDMLEKREDIV